MRKPPRPNLLVVEGTTDAVVANHLADWHRMPDYYDDAQYDGIEPLLRDLPVRVRESERRGVAVVVDADADALARWASVRDRLTPLGYAVPTEPVADGAVVQSPGAGLARVGIWIMPDNESPGMLEDFLQQLIAPADPLLPLAQSAVAAIPPDERRFPAPHRPKAEIYTWLAWQETPGSSFGPAIKRGLLDGTQPLAKSFVGWLQRAFDA